jgi:hypothetical protein
MKHCVKKYFAIIVLLILVAIQAYTASEAVARAAAFSFDSVWFYRDGTRVVPEISKRWLTVVFETSADSNSSASANANANANVNANANANDVEPTDDSFIQKKAKAIIKSHDRLVEYLYDPNIAEDACFVRMRDGLKTADISHLITQLNKVTAVRYVHPTVVLDNKTFAFFDSFEMEWKTGTPEAQRESLLKASHAVPDEEDEKGNRYVVDVAAIPFFRSLNLLAEDIRVLRVTPYLVEIKPSIRARLSLFMNGGNIGDSIPFTLTIIFSDRVSIDPSSIATLNLRPPELQKELFDCTFDPYDYAKAVSKSPIVITGRIRFFAPGELTIPSVKISYSCPSCSSSAKSTVRSIETKPVLFKVSSIIPAEQSENRLIVPTDPVSPDFRLAALHRLSQRHLWLVIICCAGLVLCAVWLLLMLRKTTAKRDRVKDRKTDGQLAEQLRLLLHETPTAPHWSYLGKVGTLLREYLVVLYGIDVKYKGGSGKQFMETIAGYVPGEFIDPLSSILAAIDTSVALESEHLQGIDQLQQEILKVVDLTANKTVARG